MAFTYSKFGQRLTKEDLRRDVNAALLSIENEIGSYHAPIVTASFHSALPGTVPTPEAVNALLYLTFSSGDAAFRQFKIPDSYVSTPAFHIHWTKSGNANEFGKAVRWRVSYVVFPSTSVQAGMGSATPTVVDVEDTYDDSGTTSRLVFSTPSVPLIGFVKGAYMSIKVERTTPLGTPLSSNPGLFSLDLTYQQYINKNMSDTV